MALPAPAVHSLSILVVEDCRDTAELLRQLLTLWGHVVYIAPDGNSAVEAARLKEIDVLILDISSPAMNDYVLMKRLDAVFSVRPLTVAATGFGTANELEMCRQAGFDYHIVKPFDLEELDLLLRGYAQKLIRI